MTLKFIGISFLLVTIIGAKALTQVTIEGKDYFVDPDIYDRATAKSMCETLDAKLVDFETPQEQTDVASFLYFYDFPYIRSYWTDGIRSNEDTFQWETTGMDFDQNLLWEPNEPSPDLGKNRVFFVADTKGLIAGQDIFQHSVLCEVKG